MKQDWTEMPLRVYYLQPGDGTRYIFGLVDLATVARDPKDFFIGASRSHIMIFPICPQGHAYPIDKHALLSPYRALVWYAKEKMQMHEETLAAIILAAGVLIQWPDQLALAGQRMLQAKNLLAGDTVVWDTPTATEAGRMENEE